MNKSVKKVPKLRFKGFSEDWEQRKLGEIVGVVRSYSLSRNVETDNDSGFRYIHYGDIHKKVADLIESDEQLPMIKAGKYELLEKGDVIVADASEDYIGIAEPSILLDVPKDRVIAGLHTIAMRPREITSLFLYYLLHTNDFKRFGGRVGTGMKVFGITTTNLFRYPALLPIKDEQKKISKSFYQLDNLITLHQRKYDALVRLKEAYLQNMFPGNTEYVPKVRFTNFSEIWEHRKLGEMADFFNEKRIPIDSRLRKTGVYPYYGASGVIDYVQDYIFDGEYVLLAEDGANIIMRNSPIAYLTQGKFWLNNHAHIMRMKDGDNYFLLQILEKKSYVKYNTGTAQPKLNSEIVKKMSLTFPSCEEQVRIGELFNQLDNLITLQQLKLEKLQNLKKAYLQKLFV